MLTLYISVLILYLSNNSGSEWIMPKGFKTINVDVDLYDSLAALSDKVAKKEGLSKISFKQLIERMKKVYEDNLEQSE
jgi:hypothetical protein